MANRRTVLIVDDEESILLSLQRIFELSGDFEVLTALNVDEAWQAINKILPDLILSDIAMPDTDGIEFCKMIRNHELTRNLPFIFLTAKSERLIEGIKAGGDDFILKPFNFDEVMAKIEAIFRRIKNTRELASQLKGSLIDYSVDDILQMCNDKSISGTVLLYNRGETGKIIIEKGDIKEIHYGDQSPTKALDTLRLWNSGLFVIRPVDIGLKPELIKKKSQSLPRPELNEAIPITEQTWWVGYQDMERRIQINSYLRIFEHSDRRINLLVETGAPEYHKHYKDKISSIIGNIGNLQIAAVMHTETEYSLNWQNLQKENPKIVFVTSKENLKRLKPFDINTRHVKLIDALKNQQLKLITEHRLKFIPVPFCPERGSFLLYDPQTRVLYSGLLFGSVFNYKKSNRLFAAEDDWDNVRDYHIEWIPSGRCLQFAVEQVKKLDPSPVIIAPQFGMIWRGSVVNVFMERLFFLETGVDLQLHKYPYDRVEKIIQAGNRLLEQVRQLFPFTLMEGKVHQDALLMARCVLEEGKIKKIYGSPDGFFERLVNTLIKGEDESIAAQIQSFANDIAKEFDLAISFDFSNSLINGEDLFGNG
ncbi:MAG: response regulator [Calditrichaeota bacterium]|nr:response regulator [Calditrichota bacterium]